ncbi:MAG TPA: pyridoxal-dependent decarboxylase, partial [Thermomonas sp.]|nr:pyridoxal-dependent decarboxylase [Thermomonas sp.]
MRAGIQAGDPRAQHVGFGAAARIAQHRDLVEVDAERSAQGAGVSELFAAALNVNGMLWKSSPAATELEQVALDWLRQWVGLPEGFFGIIYDTASLSTMHAIAAARELAEPEARTEG